jgi:aryl-alcohol dehydrogenase-like predicted oxidoreductase
MLAEADLPRIVFGCGNFGGMGSSPALRHHGDGREAAHALLDHARDLGLRRFDTANTYGGGASERFLGEWLASQDGAFRAGVEVATKVGNPHGCPPGDRPLSGAQVAFHLDTSLRRLRLERIGLYYLHEPDASTPLEETLEALDRALAAGKIAAFGLPTWAPPTSRRCGGSRRARCWPRSPMCRTSSACWSSATWRTSSRSRPRAASPTWPSVRWPGACSPASTAPMRRRRPARGSPAPATITPI